ncbi:hypothetical protein VNO77_18857 [Canavalia gladiata]|uniref:Uncharacterized protein n=1 Tax=Canavalia gladiata TaxID=3824 RepID=A0AAN9QP28_CANGL
MGFQKNSTGSALKKLNSDREDLDPVPPMATLLTYSRMDGFFWLLGMVLLPGIERYDYPKNGLQSAYLWLTMLIYSPANGSISHWIHGTSR